MNNTIGFRRLNAICDGTFALVNLGKLNNQIYQSHYAEERINKQTREKAEDCKYGGLQCSLIVQRSMTIVALKIS